MEAEAAFAGKMAAMTEKQRQRLVKLMGSPPDPTRVPPSFWTDIANETQKTTVGILWLLFMASANFHATGSASGKGLDPSKASIIQGKATAFAQAESVKLARQWAQTGANRLKVVQARYLERLGKIAQALEDGRKPPPGFNRIAVKEATTKILGPARAESAAVTETTVAQTKGGEAGILVTSGISLGDRWITEADKKVCPICAPLHKTRREFWGKLQQDGPPAHPSCRCHIKYATSEVKA